MRQSTLAKLTLSLVSLSICLVLGELVLRIGFSRDRARAQYAVTRSVFQFNEAHVEYDESLGYVTRPDLSVAFSNREFDTRIRTNSLGFRDDEESLRDPEILIVGDSFPFGWGVDQDETLQGHLERQTGRRFLNMGVPGYGTFQQLSLLRRFARSRDLSGRVALFFFYGNDLADNIRHPLAGPHEVLGVSPYLKSTAAGLEAHVRPKQAFEAWLAETQSMRSPFYQRSYLAYALRMAPGAIWTKIRRLVDPGFSEPDVPSEEDEFEVFDAILAELSTVARETDLRVLFFYVPSLAYFEGDSDDERFARFEASLERASIPMLDLRVALSRDSYFPLDGHWTAAGHEQVASAVASFLAERQVIEAPGSSALAN